MIKLLVFSVMLVCVIGTRSVRAEDDSNPFLDMASQFLQETLANQGGGGSPSAGGLLEMASMIGSMMQSSDGGSGKTQSGASQIIAGIGSLLANSGGGGGAGGGFDPSIIGNVIEMFSGAASGGQQRGKRSSDSGNGLETIMTVAQSFLSMYNNQRDEEVETNEVNYEEKRNPYSSEPDDLEKPIAKPKPKPQKRKSPGDEMMDLLPVLMQTVGGFFSQDMEKTQERHKNHASILPPFLENIHVMWDQFSNSELGQAIYQRIGLNKVFKGFTDEKGKIDYDRLFETLQMQSFRRKWIHQAITYMVDWVIFLADPAVYSNYIATGQMMANSYLQSQGYPKSTFIDLKRPTETLSSLINFIVKKNLRVDVESSPYIAPIVEYIKSMAELGKNKVMLESFKSNESSNLLTDTFNLEIIEPILRIHRGYRLAVEHPKCDQYILCELNSIDPKEKKKLGGFKSTITKFGSYGAAWFISEKTETPFWSLFASVNNPYECDLKYRVDCQIFHETEEKVRKEYVHTEL